MGERTGIAWTDATWNPWRGCRKVSPGCAHCYMYREQTRYGRDPRVVVRASPATFNAPLRWPSPRRVFTCSWSDFFIEEADAWRDDAWDVIRHRPSLTFQILTKRPERIDDHLPVDWGKGFANVWLGVSGETLEWAERRGRILRDVPAQIRFLSAEPWLETYRPTDMRRYIAVAELFDWVIVGGESGPGYRPMDERSALAMVNAVALSDRPVFLKQLGGPVGAKRDHEAAMLDGRTWTEMPA